MQYKIDKLKIEIHNKEDLNRILEYGYFHNINERLSFLNMVILFYSNLD